MRLFVRFARNKCAKGDYRKAMAIYDFLVAMHLPAPRPIFYRLRGSAKRELGQYNAATLMVRYQTSTKPWHFLLEEAIARRNRETAPSGRPFISAKPSERF